MVGGLRIRSEVWNVCAGRNRLQHLLMSEEQDRIHRKDRDVRAARPRSAAGFNGKGHKQADQL